MVSYGFESFELRPGLCFKFYKGRNEMENNNFKQWMKMNFKVLVQRTFLRISLG